MRRWLIHLLARPQLRRIHDIEPKSRQRIVRLRERSLTLEISWSSLARALRLHWLRIGAGTAIAIGVIALVSNNIGRANIATLYATSCLGGWENPQLAEGKPDVDELGADAELFTSKNSAQLKASAAQIFCGGFRGEVPQDVEPKKVLLKLSWAVLGASPAVPASGPEVPVETPVEAPVVVVDETLKPEQVESIIDSDGVQAVELRVADPGADSSTSEAPPEPVAVPDKAAPEPVPVPSPVLETSWLPWRVARATAQELQDIPADPSGTASAATASTLDGAPALATPTAEAIAPEATPIEPLVATPVDPPFLQVLYTLDGKEWSKLAEVSAANWRDLSVELPLTSWDQLATVQVSLQTVPSLAEQPVVLLDSVRLEVEYAGDAAAIQDQPDFSRDTVLQLLADGDINLVRVRSASRQRQQLWVYQAAGDGTWTLVSEEPELDPSIASVMHSGTVVWVTGGSGTIAAYQANGGSYASQTVEPGTSTDMYLSGGAIVRWDGASLALLNVDGSAAEAAAAKNRAAFMVELGGPAAVAATTTTPLPEVPLVGIVPVQVEGATVVEVEGVAPPLDTLTPEPDSVSPLETSAEPTVEAPVETSAPVPELAPQPQEPAAAVE